MVTDYGLKLRKINLKENQRKFAAEGRLDVSLLHGEF